MKKHFGDAKLMETSGKPIVWRVLVGSISTMEAANELAQRIRTECREQVGNAFVVRIG